MTNRSTRNHHCHRRESLWDRRSPSPTGAVSPVLRENVIRPDSPMCNLTPLYPNADRAPGQGDSPDRGILPGDTIPVRLGYSGVTIRVVDSDTKITDPVMLAWLKQQPTCAGGD